MVMSDGWIGGVSLWGGEDIFVVVRGGRYQWRGFVVGVGRFVVGGVVGRGKDER